MSLKDSALNPTIELRSLDVPVFVGLVGVAVPMSRLGVHYFVFKCYFICFFKLSERGGRTWWDISKFAAPGPSTNVYLEPSGWGRGAHDEKLANLLGRAQLLMSILNVGVGAGRTGWEINRFAAPGPGANGYFHSSGRGRIAHDDKLANLPRRAQY